MECCRLLLDYQRNVYFQYDTEKSAHDRFAFEQNTHINDETPATLYYTVDQEDSYLKEYDFLPCIGLSLVSEAVKIPLQKCAPDSVKFYPSEINFIDTGQSTTTFYALAVTKIIPCLDKQKFVIKLLLPSRPLGPKKLESIYLDKVYIGSGFIFKIKSYEKIIMVSEFFIDERN